MVACNDQYCCGRDNNLYVYTCGRPVRDYYDNGYCGNDQYYPNVCGDRTALPEQCSTDITCQFNKYTGNNRNMVACNDQHSCGGYNNLYLCPCGRAMRYFYYAEYRGND